MSVQVPKGYKQTEVGVIPEDWQVLPLAEIASIERGKFSARPRNDPRFYGGEYPFIQTGDVTRSNGLIRKFTQTLNLEGLRVSKFFPRGTLFFTIAANIADVGISTFDAACPDSLVAINTNEKHLNEWLCFLLATQKNNFENLATPGAQLNLNLEKIRPYLIAVPTENEQHAIAEALSDADALIESLEQLIAKKRQIKQGAMQELLTAQRRLPGFSGEWQSCSLFQLAENKKEFFDDGDWIESEHIVDQGIRIIQTGNIGIGEFVEKDEKKYISDKSFTDLRCKKVEIGDLLICRLAEPAGRACVLQDIGERKIVTSVDVSIFRAPLSVVNRYFLSALFSSDSWFKLVSDRSGGTIHKRISRGALGNIEIKLPELAEQDAIASMFCAMDSEIQALENRAFKARQIKQAMMQELLTGRIRLI